MNQSNNQSNNQSEYGICPLMSNTQVIPVPVNAGSIQSIKQDFMMQPTNAVANCCGENCQLWDDPSKRCSIALLAPHAFEIKENLRDIHAVLQPAESLPVATGNAYANALNATLEKLTYLVENLFKKKPL